MTSRMSFRQHVLLIVFLDLFMLLFMNLTSTSFIKEFISGGGFLTGTLITIVLTIFIGISAIGLTAQSSGGISGILAGTLGKLVSASPVMAPVFLIIGDYVLIYTTIASDPSQWVKITATIILFPLILDSIFASIDWARGINT